MCSLQCDILDLDGKYGPLYRPVPSRHGIPGMQNLHFCFRGEGWSFPGEDGDWHMIHMMRAIDVIGAHWDNRVAPFSMFPACTAFVQGTSGNLSLPVHPGTIQRFRVRLNVEIELLLE